MGNILYIPIQINGGETLPDKLLDRELFIKNGELYVGNESGEPIMIIGKVVGNAIIDNPTLTGVVKLGEGVAPQGYEGGTLVFKIDERFVDVGGLQRRIESLETRVGALENN